MDLRRLEIFCKIAELQSFSKAAKAVLLSQPTVSEHIQSLEETLGIKLFDRLGRQVVLTKGGQLFYDYARRILSLYQETLQVLDQFQGRLRGNLSLGGSTIPGTYILPELLGRFKEEYPEVQITLRIGDTRQIIQGVLEGEIELGVAGAKKTDERLDYIEFVKDELILVTVPGHRWAERGSISVEELLEEPFIMREKGSGTREIMEQVLKGVGINSSELNIIAEIGSTEAVIQAVKKGMGVSIVSRRPVEEELGNGRLRPIHIQGVTFLRNFYIVTCRVRTLSPLAQAFKDFLLSCRRSTV